MKNTSYIIGSHAIRRIYPEFPRQPNDMDVLISDMSDKEEWDKQFQEMDFRVEYLFCPPLFSYLESQSTNGVDGNILLTLKCSHIFWDIKTDKHLHDICFLFQKKHVIIKPLFNQLYDYWQFFHGPNKRSNLQMNAQSFFTNALPKIYDHDYLHTIINPSPTYLKILKDGAEVDVSEEKFNYLTFNEKLDLVREEIYVMAWERQAGRDYRAAYYWMLKKFLMNHAPLWEALFMLENWRKLDRPIFNYINKINNAIH